MYTEATCLIKHVCQSNAVPVFHAKSILLCTMMSEVMLRLDPYAYVTESFLLACATAEFP